jgi:dTDP-4-dehydrorhamnose 3,5-epimerase
MNVTETALPGVLLIEPRVFRDDRGALLETWSRRRFRDAGLPERFVQDNLSRSRRGVLRGLHYQHPNGQGKLVSVARGEVYDVAVDIRPDSPRFGRWVGYALSEADHRALYIPPGFAHGFVVLSDEAVFSYKCTEYYAPTCEASLRWDDPDMAIAWPVESPILSGKDLAAPRLRDVPRDRLPLCEEGHARLDPAHAGMPTPAHLVHAESRSASGSRSQGAR